MNLPEANLLNFFNKVLISLEDLTPKGDSCSIDSLVNHCKSVAFGGMLGEYESILDHCKYCGLISVKNDQITFSTLGHRFLNANKERYFEITEAQKQLIAERIVFKGVWSQHARELFELFYVNQSTYTYELSTVDIIVPITQNSTVHLFKFLGIINEDKLIIKVDKKYSGLVYELIADRKVLSEQQLEKILLENRKLGVQAENAVVEFEKKRLKKLGKSFQAEFVKRISPFNTAAGYDIESFDGTSDDIFPNRFIEVKATQQDEIRFYWSSNEMKVAKKKKNSYWIYMMKEFNEASPADTIPIMIQNPEHQIRKSDYLTIEGHTFLIKEAKQVDLTEYNIEELKWYQLI
jgi:hypothetical protein